MRRYLLVTLVTALIVAPMLCAWRFSDREFVELVLTARAAGTTREVVMYGNSVIDHSSKCDRDKRSIAGFAAEASAMPVLDLSRGGGTIAEMAALNGVVLRLMRPKVVIVPIAPEMFDPVKIGYSPHARRPLARLLGMAVPNDLMQAAYFTFPADYRSEALSYKGRAYGDYENLKRTFMARERAEQVCPEHDGVDSEFVEFMYWRTSRFARNGNDPRVLKSLVDDIRSGGAIPLLVFLPVLTPMYGQIDETHDAFARALADQRHYVASLGAPFVDLTDLLSHDEFADRWCACGHLTEVGRAKVGRAIADALRSMPPRSQPSDNTTATLRNLNDARLASVLRAPSH